MKVLALRGENICSLQAPFEIDFTREPLAGAGLFAISGPTGAGKSTLLDVLCLALYHTTPRLLSAPQRDVSVPDGSSADLSVSDPRNLLRKGAASGYAEVDFCGIDKRRYRARWSVRRARDAAQGKLQKIQTSIRLLDEDQLLSDALGEVSTIVIQKVGLTFAEFTRSVVLAQNEFTSFLKAGDNDKAAILEKLTGLDSFSKIGRSVYRITEGHFQELKTLNAASERTIVLSETQRAEKHAQIEFCRTRKEQHKSLVELLSEYLREQDVLKELNGQQLALQSSLAEQKEHEQKAENKVIQAEVELSDAQRERMQREPEMAQARELDARRALLADECRRSEETVQSKTHQLKELCSQAENQRKETAQHQETLTALEWWFAQNEKTRKLADNWPVLQVAFERAGSLRTKHLEQQNKFNENQQSLDEKLSRLKAIEQALLASQSEIDALKEQIRIRSESQTMHSLADLERRKTEADTQVNRIKRLVELKLGDRGDEQVTCRLQLEIEFQEKRLAELLQELSGGSAKISELETQRSVHLKMKESIELRVSQSVEALRAQLIAGEECPVCGSREHPLIAHAAEHPLRELLKEAQQNLEVVQREVNVFLEKQNALGREQAAIASVHEHNRSRVEELQNQRQARLHDWTTLSEGLELHSCDVGTLEHMLEQAVLYAKDCTTAFKSASESAAVLQKLQSDVLTRNHQHMQKSVQVQSLAQDVSRLEERRVQFKEAFEAAAEELEHELVSLDKAASDSQWRSRWLNEPSRFVQTLEKAVAQFHQKIKDADRLRIALVELSHQQKSADEKVSTNEVELASAQKSHEELSHNLSLLIAQRQGLLSGQEVTSFERALNQRISDCSDALQRAKNERHQLQVNGAALLERLKGLAERREQIRDGLTVRLGEIEHSLEHAGVSFNPEFQTSATLDWQTLPDVLLKVRGLLDELETQHVQLRGELDADARARTNLAELTARRNSCEAVYLRWKRLSDLIGCATGNRFRREAQRYTLTVLLAHANHHLESFAPRYRLLTQADSLNILIEDIDSGGELRSVYSLSGGESFLVSLALAMGLSTLSSEQVQVESLFIDEGFGSLDAESLRVALNALDALQSQGRKVGVISHVGDMAERIGVQIQVIPQGQGRSRVIVPLGVMA